MFHFKHAVLVRIKSLVPILLILVIAIIPIAAGDTLFESSKSLEIYSDVFKELNMYYVDDIEPSKLMRTGMDAMLKSLDPYTNFISEAELEGYRFQTTGMYGGIGAVIRKKDDLVAIIEPYKNSPAYKAGLRAGDLILQVDNQPMKGKSVRQMSTLLKGQPGTSINLTIKHPITDIIEDILVTREEIKLDNVPYRGIIDTNIGYIRLDQFTQNAGANIENALKALESIRTLKGVILDLRGNPGGLLSEAVNVCNVFIDRGKPVVSTKGKVKEWDREFKTMRKPVDLQIPLVILTNHGSASASEIVSGTIQDYDRGVILGELTYGKGLVQQTRDLSYNTKLKLTIAKYYTPSGRCIQALDYTHRNKDGSVSKIPDSLKTAFKTSNGRVVYDGGGVEPDLHVGSVELSKIAISLLQKDLIFDFATQYYQKHNSISGPDVFQLTDDDFEAFMAFISDKEYGYKTESEKLLDKLGEALKDENYFDATETSFSALQTRIAHDKLKDLNKFKKQIIEQIKLEIITRYYFRDGRLNASIQNDPFIKAAKQLFNNPEEYQKLLSPK